MNARTDPVRVVAGHPAPLPGRWVIDQLHSCVGVVRRHSVVARVRERFRARSGVILIAEDPIASFVGVVITAEASTRVTTAATSTSVPAGLDVQRLLQSDDERT